MQQLSRRIRHVYKIYRHDGVAAVPWEFLYKLLQPFVRVYEGYQWRRYVYQGQTSFQILGSRMTVLQDDQGVSRELAVHRIHEPLATRLLQGALRPGMTVIDIGSNIGYYALFESRLVGQSGRVYAIEPVPRNADLLRHNVRENRRTNVCVHELAIADRNGTVPMYLSSKSNWHSLLPSFSTRSIAVPARTLDDFVSSSKLSSVDLIRMDVEGYEVSVLAGMERTLKQYGPRLLVELHPHIVGSQAVVEWLRRLASHGYFDACVCDQERDTPLRWRLMKPEHMTIPQLMQDTRIVQDKRTLTVLLCCGRERNRNLAS